MSGSTVGLQADGRCSFSYSICTTPTHMRLDRAKVEAWTFGLRHEIVHDARAGAGKWFIKDALDVTLAWRTTGDRDRPPCD